MKKNIYLLGFLLVAFGMALSIGSCRKKGSTTAKIIVRDTGNYLVPGAQVILYGTSTETPIKPVIRRDTGFTDAMGEVIFNYDDVYQLGQAGVAVLNISAEKDNFRGESIIKIEEEKENTATVFIQP